MADQKLPGACCVECLPGGKLKILAADPYIWIGEELLEVVGNDPLKSSRYGDGILTIEAVNGTVNYGVGRLIAPHIREGFRSG